MTTPTCGRAEQERPVALVGLEDEDVAGSAPRAAAALVEVAADQVARDRARTVRAPRRSSRWWSSCRACRRRRSRDARRASAASACCRAHTGMPRSRAARARGCASPIALEMITASGVAEPRPGRGRPTTSAPALDQLARAPSSPSGRSRAPRCPARGAAGRGCACPRRRRRSCAPSRTPSRVGTGSVGMLPGGRRVRPHAATSATRSAIRSSASGAPTRASPPHIAARRGSSSRSAVTRSREGRRRQVRLEHDLGAPRALHLAAVGLLMVLGGVGVRHEDRRHPADRELRRWCPTPPARRRGRSTARARSMRSMNPSTRTSRSPGAAAAGATSSTWAAPVATSNWRSSPTAELADRRRDGAVELASPLAPAEHRHRTAVVVEVERAERFGSAIGACGSDLGDPRADGIAGATTRVPGGQPSRPSPRRSWRPRRAHRAATRLTTPGTPFCSISTIGVRTRRAARIAGALA